MLKKSYIRDDRHRLMGSITDGYVGSFETLVRDERDSILGRTSARFRTTRDAHGRLVSINHAEEGLLLARKK